MVIACSDSRVNPSLIANAEPGDIFVVRNVANLVPPYDPNTNYLGTSACIEFAVQDLGVRHIIVLGHSHCGGINRLCERAVNTKCREFIDPWVSIANSALDSKLDGDEQYGQVEREAVRVSLNNLLTFPWLKTKFDKIPKIKLRTNVLMAFQGKSNMLNQVVFDLSIILDILLMVYL